MNKFTKYVSLTVLSLIVLSNSVSAEPLSDQLQKQQNQLQQDKNNLKDVQAKSDSLDLHIEHLDNEIQTMMSQIQDNKNQINKKQEEIKNTEIQIQAFEIELQKTKDLFNKRMREMYVNNTDGYLEILLTSNGIGDLMSRIETVKTLVKYDQKIIKDINDKKEEINLKKNDLKNQNDKLLTLAKDNEIKMAKLTENRTIQGNLVEELKKQEKLLNSTINQSQSQVNSTLKQIEDIRKAAPKVSLSRGSAPISSNNIIAYASNFLGTPYVWGGTTPVPGFDCSGFTQYVYAHFGVGLGRTTFDQIHDGTPVSRDQLEAGDLVFFGTWDNPHHVGIYVGNNTYIHAPHTGDVIKISDMTRVDFVTARRVK